jgi:hypothetical protein
MSVPFAIPTGFDRLVATVDNSKLIGHDMHVIQLKDIFNASTPIQRMLKTIVAEKRRVNIVHVFSGDINWNSSIGASSDVVVVVETNDMDPLSFAKNHDHPCKFLSDLIAKYGEGWADIVVYSAPSNSLLLAHYLNACGPTVRSRFYEGRKLYGVKNGDAGLASSCRDLMERLLHPTRGRAVTISFKSTGFGINRRFMMEQLWTMNHPLLSSSFASFACHDTIVTIERRMTRDEKIVPRLCFVNHDQSVTPNVYRTWSMYATGGQTFSVHTIRSILNRVLRPGDTIVDPFARRSDIGTVRNDLNVEMPTHYHMDGIAFLEMIAESHVQYDVVLLDPPYSGRQNRECYQGIGNNENNKEEYTINASLYSRCKSVIARILKPGGLLLTFGWSSVGCNNDDVFKMTEIAVVCHGGAHDDSIVTIEMKL